MRLATTFGRFLTRCLLVALPWLPLGVAAGWDAAAVDGRHCTQPHAMHEQGECPQSAPDICPQQCTHCSVCVALPQVLAPLVAVAAIRYHWSQSTTAPPLRPPRTRQV